MIKKALTFAIDFDGVLTNDRRWIISEVANYFGISTYSFKDLSSKMDLGYMGISKAASKEFWYSHSDEFESLPICQDAIKGIKMLKFFGHKVYCTTARGSFFSKEYQDKVRKSTRNRIESAHIPFDDIVFTDQKGELLQRVLNHDVIIDDDPNHFATPPTIHLPNQDWGGTKHPVEICFGYESYNAPWVGNRISSFYELDTIYPGIFNTSFLENPIHEI